MGGGGSQTSTQDNSPWDPQEPFLIEGLQQAQNWLRTKPQENPAPISGSTWRGIEGLENFGNSPGLQVAQTYAREVAGGTHAGSVGRDVMQGYAQNGGFTDPGAMAGLRSMASQEGYGDAGAEEYYRGVMANGARDAQGTDYLRRAAAGDFLTDRNPYFQEFLNDTLAAGRANLDSSYASTGRLGSGAHAAAAADAAMRTSTALGYQDYQSERARQDAAAGALVSSGFTDAGIRTNAAGLLDTGARADTSQRIGLLGNLNAAAGAEAAGRLGAAGAYDNSQMANISQRLQASQLAPELEMQGIQAMLGAGAARDGYSQQEHDAFYNTLARYKDLVGTPYGSVTSTTGPKQDNTGMYVGAGASLAASAASVAIAI